MMRLGESGIMTKGCNDNQVLLPINQVHTNDTIVTRQYRAMRITINVYMYSTKAIHSIREMQMARGSEGSKFLFYA